MSDTLAGALTIVLLVTGARRRTRPAHPRRLLTEAGVGYRLVR